ncbi:TetR/AcrR family transcriptional regulator [Streptomyces mutabilis]|uniref:TetR/AcrR family transcriptional regulator n=1 Tax=Streptomyces TaxID=1883 RepID=UPI000BD38212|nr:MULTISPECIES: TetR/AcrR family transcriptional regulator [unclassified Streptomyces]MDN3245930.1 TetR family transcriptional regulator [Streptomyces sp. ZSW22]MDN3254190.1 TetR family transcriptional regulator [Streptomyces sp. MA25(2023)]PAK27647.1 TetR family transcriptional regulator [Streptomyces sp. alain-838]
MTTVTTAPRRQGRGGRERILAAAAGLFAAQGINATGMEQIAERAPVSKRTLYAHFRTKDELVLAHLKDLASTGHTLEGALAREDIPPRERILTLFDPPPAGTDPVRGCPFIDAAVEFPDPQNAVHSYARERKLLMARLVTELVAELGCREPSVLAEQLVTLADGAASRAMVLGDPNYGRHARAAAEILLDNALPTTV